MKDLVSILIVGFGITGFVGGGIAYVLFAPKLLTDRRQWFKRSMLSSFFGASGIFILVLSMDAENLLRLQYKALWNSILLMLVYFFLGGIVLTLLNYARILILEKYNEMMGHLIKRLNNRKK